MSQVLSDFAATGNGKDLLVRKGEEFDYSVVGTFVGTYILESSNDASNYSQVATGTASGNGSVKNETNGDLRYRFRCSAYTSGTLKTSLINVEESSLSGLGSKNGANVRVLEYGDKGIHRSEFTFSNMPVSVVSVTTGAGVGGTKFYDFPEGSIRILGCVAELSLGVDVQGDFTDGTPEGDVGVGTVAPANADALGTDATDDNLGTATAFTMSAYADADINIPSEAALNIDGTTTPVDAYVNILVDAGDIDDSTTTDVFVSGSLVITWANLGDY